MSGMTTLSGADRSAAVGVRAWLKPAAGAVIVVFGVSGLAHAARVAGAGHPTIEALGDFVLESLDLAGDTAPAIEPAADATTAAVQSLSEDDVKKLLAEELAALSGADWMTESEP